MCKHSKVLGDIIFPHFHHLFPTEKSRQIALKNPKAFNIEHLVELVMANIGGYNFVDEYGRDFDDANNSDSKTCTLRAHDSSLCIGKIEHKIGSFRVVCYNEIKNSLDYFYIPNLGRLYEREKGYIAKDRNQERIRARYTSSTDSYNKFEKYRVKNFYEVATMTDEKMFEYNPMLSQLKPREFQFERLFVVD